ncbi:MAG: SerC, partial [Bacilli bacterium]|nr:SerC [Bacilli bacterium]
MCNWRNVEHHGGAHSSDMPLAWAEVGDDSLTFCLFQAATRPLNGGRHQGGKTMSKRVYNFNPGPAALPVQILQQGQEEFVEFQDLGMSIMEISHRSKQYEQLNDETQQLLLKILGIKSGYQVLFMAGGASTQFALVPMNFLKTGQVGSYVLTGSFAEKAYQEAAIIGETAIAASTSEQKWSRLPAINEIDIAANSAYLHLTGNNTI